MAIGILVPASAFKLVTNVCCVYLQHSAQVSSRFNSIQFTANCSNFNIQEIYSDLANTEGSDTAKFLPVSDQFDTLAKTKGSPTVSYPLNALAKAGGSASVIPV
jgi:hypothetical protein